jgi:transcriptional regulator with XRE-family HTH domain
VTHQQFRSALARLGLSQARAAQLVGADERTGRRWALGERSVPQSVAVLLQLLLAGKITIADIEASSD